MFKNIHDYIYRKTGQFMYIAVSGLFNDYHELPQVMDAVDTLMNNKFYETGRYIFLIISVKIHLCLYRLMMMHL